MQSNNVISTFYFKQCFIKSRESLQGLAEKIGEKMQESLIQATQGIQQGLESSLEKIMAPAINKLVDETS
ncbi:hypothetical protein B2J68_19900, partial [Vibrio cholerae]